MGFEQCFNIPVVKTLSASEPGSTRCPEWPKAGSAFVGYIKCTAQTLPTPSESVKTNGDELQPTSLLPNGFCASYWGLIKPHECTYSEQDRKRGGVSLLEGRK